MLDDTTRRGLIARYGAAVLLPVAAALLTIGLGSALERTIFALFIVAVVVATFNGGLGPGIVATVLGLILSTWFILLPHHEYLFTGGMAEQACVFLLVAGVILLMGAARLREMRRARTNERWLQTAIRSIGDAVIATDGAGRVTFMNPVAQALTGWTQEDAAGKPLVEIFNIVNEETRAAVENPVEKVIKEGVVVGLANHTVLISRSGDEIPIEDSAAPIRNDDGEIHGVIMVFHDVSERRRREVESRFLFDSSEVLTSSLDYETTLGRVAALAVPYIADWCAVDILDEDGAVRRLAVAHVDPDKVKWARELDRRYPANPDDPAGLYNVLRTGKSELYPDISEELLKQGAKDPEHLEVLRQVGFSSVMLVPLTAQGRTFGALSFIAAESGRHFDRSSLALAEEIGRHAATAVYNARLYRDARNGADEARRHASRLEVLADTTSEFVDAKLDFDVVLDTVARRVAEEIGDTCVVRLLSGDGEMLDLAAIHTPDPAIAGFMHELLASAPQHANDGVLGKVIRDGEPVLIADVDPASEAQVTRPEYRPYLDRAEVKSLLVVPMRVQGRVMGTIGVARNRPDRPYTSDDQSLLQDIADRAALVIENSRLFRDMRGQREWFEVTLSSIGDAVIATDPEGSVTFMNGVARDLTGWGDEGIGVPLAKIFTIVNEYTREPVESPVDKVLREGLTVGLANHTVLIAKDGTEHPIDDSAAPIRDTEGELRGVVLVFHDITERKEVEEERTQLFTELQQERKRLTDLFASVPGVVWEAWGGPDTPAQRIDYVSDFVESMLGYTREEWLSTPNFWLSIVHPDDKERAARETAAIFTQAGFGDSQFRWVARDGRVLWVDSRSVVIYDDEGRPLGMRGVTMDATARKLADQAIRESEERFRAMADSVPVLIWIAGTDALCNFFNKTWLEFTGRTMEQEQGDGWTEGVHPDDLRQCMDIYLAAFEARHEFRMEYRLRRADGEYRWVFDNGIPRFTPDGTFVGYIGSCIDTNDRRLAEEELKRARDLAEAASDAKDQFLAVLSHELRTPLTPVLATAQALEAEESLPEDIRPFVEIIRRNVELEVNLIDDLLDLVRVARGKLQVNAEVEDLHGLVRNVLEICRADIIEKRLDLTVHLRAQAHHANVDPARLQQVIWNLIKNAVKFTPEGGSITVRSFNGADGGTVVIEIADTGIGIDPEVITRIFNSFEQGEQSVTRRFGGLGLGLAISKALVDMQGGALTAASPGRDLGATFTVEFAALDLVAGTGSEPGSGQLPGEEKRSLRILLVDDHVDTNNVMRILLERKGYDVTSAHSVGAALDLASRKEFDLLVSDIGLPDGSGLDIVSAMRPIRAIALSGFGMEGDIVRSREAGFSEHLVKPVSFSRLHEAIQRVTS